MTRPQGHPLVGRSPADLPVVCVSSPSAAEHLIPASGSIAELVVWDGLSAPPRGVEATTLWVPRYPPDRQHLHPSAYRHLPQLEIVQLLSAGYDAYTDHVPPGVQLCHARGVHRVATAEWVLGATLCLLRGFPDFVRAQDRRDWAPRPGRELSGRRAAVIGAGDVGRAVADRLTAFGTQVRLVARAPRPGVTAVADLPQLLPEIDLAILTVPLTARTTRLVDSRVLAALPDGAVIVNAARGPVIDTDALTAELASGRLSAALDVTDPEPLPDNHPLWTLPNVLLTPHIGAAVDGFERRAYGLVRTQIERITAGMEPLNRVCARP